MVHATSGSSLRSSPVSLAFPRAASLSKRDRNHIDSWWIWKKGHGLLKMHQMLKVYLLLFNLIFFLKDYDNLDQKY